MKIKSPSGTYKLKCDFCLEMIDGAPVGGDSGADLHYQCYQQASTPGRMAKETRALIEGLRNSFESRMAELELQLRDAIAKHEEKLAIMAGEKPMAELPDGTQLYATNNSASVASAPDATKEREKARAREEAAVATATEPKRKARGKRKAV